ncbi:MAG TPA: methyltransferase domain-containing protein [Terriglobia bacterium]|nr:methyltransferase domain-containing protein [Terriglobia bacterium]
MSDRLDLYDTSYENYAARLYQEVRRETYGEDIGQTGWMTTSEFRQFLAWLELDARSRVLEVGCGAGGCAVFMAENTGCHVTGLDVNENGIRNARELARARGLESRTRFEQTDASRSLPFPDAAFDAVFSNDAMCHIPGRLAVLTEWRRVLRPGGRMLFTDAMIVTGLVSSQELATRSSIGYYLFLPAGENERLIEQAGFRLRRADDLTPSAAVIAGRWREARARRSAELIKIEGEPNFGGLQKFLAAVETLSGERRLSRFAYWAERP